jgi:hypothetical protein
VPADVAAHRALRLSEMLAVRHVGPSDAATVRAGDQPFGRCWEGAKHP